MTNSMSPLRTPYPIDLLSAAKPRMVKASLVLCGTKSMVSVVWDIVRSKIQKNRQTILIPLKLVGVGSLVRVASKVAIAQKDSESPEESLPRANRSSVIHHC